jgi:hypothetical protein
MFDYWRERRRLRREIAAMVRRGEEQEAALAERPSALAGPLVIFELLEYERLKRKARRLGIDYQGLSDNRDGYEITEDGQLSGEGYARLRKAIRDERLSIAEKWVKILVPLITAIAGLVGVLVALVSLSRK